MSVEAFPLVTTSDLSRAPGAVIARVARGERLIVCRHKRPIATIQPLDGYIFQPFTGTAADVFGWPIGGELTARGLALREHLMKESGRADEWELGGSLLGFKRGRLPEENL